MRLRPTSGPHSLETTALVHYATWQQGVPMSFNILYVDLLRPAPCIFGTQITILVQKIKLTWSSSHLRLRIMSTGSIKTTFILWDSEGIQVSKWCESIPTTVFLMPKHRLRYSKNKAIIFYAQLFKATWMHIHNSFKLDIFTHKFLKYWVFYTAC